MSHCTVKPLIKDTPRKDKPPNKGQAESIHTLQKITTAGPEGILYSKCIQNNGVIKHVLQLISLHMEHPWPLQWDIYDLYAP